MKEANIHLQTGLGVTVAVARPLRMPKIVPSGRRQGITGDLPSGSSEAVPKGREIVTAGDITAAGTHSLRQIKARRIIMSWMEANRRRYVAQEEATSCRTRAVQLLPWYSALSHVEPHEK